MSLIFLNGLPIITIELKNPWTNQTVYKAKTQYQDRDPNEPLFQFGRCLVHFALDTDEAWMTTRLAGKNTYFLPFNKGHNHGKGNPVNPNGHKTAYLWQDILTRPSLANILEHFVLLEGKPKDPLTKKTLIFPRYHQRDVVQGLLADAQQNGTGKTYLIQHSAGSGKSNSITWLAFQLIQLYPQQSTDPLFNSVIVVTDRQNLDKQLRDNIRDFSEIKNIIAHAKHSSDLKTALEEGKKIIITTIQKFRFIVEEIENLGDNRFAVIIDEAHSSQSGRSADTLNLTINKDDEEEEDNQDKILQVMKGRKLSKNASYFAFTATPKPATLEKFGRPTPDGGFAPFHLYSMKQAIEEGFILDVLANYTTYKSYYEIQKSIQANPLFDTATAQKKLKAYVEGHKDTIASKAEIIVTHFLENVVNPKKMKGKAKGMVVTRSISAAIRYYFQIQQRLRQHNATFQAIVAFSGKKTVDGIEYSEDSLNGFPSKDIEDNFKDDKYRLLIVANKFLTGFDEPLLHTMYVDKKLQSVRAVQTLSRLNRCNNKLGKTDTFILDFYNTTDDIRTAFAPFYTATSLSEATDVNVLHDLKEALDDVGVYETSEIEDFNHHFFNGADAEQLSPIIDTAAQRFNHDLDLEDADKIDFKIKAKQFVKIYAQLACLIPFNNLHWEKLHWFLKFLIPKLHVRNPQHDQLDELLNSVDLTTYGIERVTLNQAIPLDADSREINPQNPNPRGYHEDEKHHDPLDEIIATFNQRFFGQWNATPEEQKIKLVKLARHVATNPNYQTQVVNNPDTQNSRLAISKLIKQAINQERRNELTLYRNYASDADFQRALETSIIRILEADRNNPAK
ncbi:Type III restriction enzyme, res subunit family [Coleofasciculus chthonoplastes PCC 7420]|uniref:Type III restriction enzyme, res subunit family n=1 Tax=Coleofasciculus chthonoplastes PCC 7420 TaxID=118168 RepID=B4VK67_9CYAN|nr:DEAD/DEAH box helicase family protein [Coleofasciculus chthonoplastes]EDX77724.1 Type III restriction enzyme, res subunit family [Coleofasciculus chthonoplastes PCC 7420]